MKTPLISGFTKILATSSLLIAASPAMALFNAEASVGQRTGSWKVGSDPQKDLTSSSLQIAAHLDPIPLVPVSFGVRYVSDAYDAKVADHGVKSLTSSAIVPEVKAWIPLGDLKPFARVGYTVASGYKGTAEVSVGNESLSGNLAFKSTGSRLAAGLEWDFLPLVSITGSLEYSNEELSLETEKIGSYDIEGDSDTKFASTAVLFGVSAGL